MAQQHHTNTDQLRWPHSPCECRMSLTLPHGDIPYMSCPMLPASVLHDPDDEYTLNSTSSSSSSPLGLSFPPPPPPAFLFLQRRRGTTRCYLRHSVMYAHYLLQNRATLVSVTVLSEVIVVVVMPMMMSAVVTVVNDGAHRHHNHSPSESITSTTSTTSSQEEDLLLLYQPVPYQGYIATAADRLKHKYNVNHSLCLAFILEAQKSAEQHRKDFRSFARELVALKRHFKAADGLPIP